MPTCIEIPKWVSLLFMFCILISTLHGCGSPSTRTTTTTIATTTSTTTTTIIAKVDLRALEDYNSDFGVAMSILAGNTWEAGPGTGSSGFGADSATFYDHWNQPINYKVRQSMSIGNHKKSMQLYFDPNFGYGTWGLAFSLREEHGYWKFFETHENCRGLGKPLMGDCGDCFGFCCGKLVGSHLVGDQLSYGQWKSSVMEILKLTAIGHPERCGGHEPVDRNWNEYNTNGLSYDAVYGVVNNTFGNNQPKEQDVCNFMEKVNAKMKYPRDKPWPIYNYYHSSAELNFSRYLNCHTTTTVGAVVTEPVNAIVI